jgi:hypothetical protein
MPVAAAIERVDQCVAFVGVSSNVLTITCSTSSSLIVRGAPGRGSSCRPSRRRSRNRVRHFATVPRVIPRRSPISVFEPPSAHANTIRHRNANACAVVGRRAHRSSVSRSSSLNTTTAAGVPGCVIAASHRRLLRRQNAIHQPEIPNRARNTDSGHYTGTGAENPRSPPRVPPIIAAFSSAGTPTNCLAMSSRLPRNVPSAWG